MNDNDKVATFRNNYVGEWPSPADELSPEQINRLHRIIETNLDNPDALYLYRHDPVYRAFVKHIASAAKVRQPIRLEGFASLIQQICEGAFRAGKHAERIAQGTKIL